MSKGLKDNRFTLAKAKSKTEDWQSDYNGKVNIVCSNCGEANHAYLNGYINSNDYGKYFSGPLKHFQPTVEAVENEMLSQEEQSQDLDEDIPF
jgi:hypothetical protein